MGRLLLAVLLVGLVGCEEKADTKPEQKSIRTIVPFTYIVTHDDGKTWKCIVDELKPLDTFRIANTNQIGTKFAGECYRYSKEPT